MLPLPNACPKKGIQHHFSARYAAVLRHSRGPVPAVGDFPGWLEWCRESLLVWTFVMPLPYPHAGLAFPSVNEWDWRRVVVAEDCPWPVYVLCHEVGHHFNQGWYPPVTDHRTGERRPAWCRYPAEGDADEFGVCLAIGKKELLGRLKDGQGLPELAREWRFPLRALELRARLAGCRFV